MLADQLAAATAEEVTSVVDSLAATEQRPATSAVDQTTLPAIAKLRPCSAMLAASWDTSHATALLLTAAL